ncbi:MAG: F-box protein [Alphaproteobacteria bacterium]
MSRNLTSLRFLKLACIAFMAPQLAFSTNKLETPSEPNEEPQALVAAPAPAPEASLFERLPSDIIKLILAELSKKDLVSLRSVEKKLRDMVTPLITNV